MAFYQFIGCVPKSVGTGLTDRGSGWRASVWNRFRHFAWAAARKLVTLWFKTAFLLCCRLWALGVRTFEPVSVWSHQSGQGQVRPARGLRSAIIMHMLPGLRGVR